MYDVYEGNNVAHRSQLYVNITETSDNLRIFIGHYPLLLNIHWSMVKLDYASVGGL